VKRFFTRRKEPNEQSSGAAEKLFDRSSMDKEHPAGAKSPISGVASIGTDKSVPFQNTGLRSK
jgi:hypothetical protein